ncbi:telomere repeats-binding bouquet formation protein 2 isoform X2 [Neopsephotus bourkii]|uniref:telomere repeats-binding bouquet formation protein 2 isoform X2 n=1 Tax=Neopsephotus bourkii TaxID=309878 RepID=UPI002AA56997|nr:telomere repeats-binding bouquet formation protein 2 isoform X2 [Neopsephotus bourkii]
MFRGRSAWFSQSVSPGQRELWAAGGGEYTRWQDAEYLFSSDAAHPDTRRIHESLSYLEGRATVFHSSYLSAWANSSAEEKMSVALGHFVLPPACLQEEIRRQIGCFIWEQADGSLAEQRNRNLTDRPETAGTGGEEEEDEHMLDPTQSEEETDPTAPEGECPHRALHEYPTNNMVTGYAAARDMRKYVGEIHDFIPGTSGYKAYWVKQKINLSGDMKTRMKRKL